MSQVAADSAALNPRRNFSELTGRLPNDEEKNLRGSEYPEPYAAKKRRMVGLDQRKFSNAGLVRQIRHQPRDLLAP
jgi:hypothetical protein